MNNEDRFSLAFRESPLKAAALALDFADGCGSKNRAWYWANRAIEVAREGGIELDGGELSWPETDKMRARLEEVVR